MVTGQPLLIDWEICPSISVRRKISLVSWIVSTETDPRPEGNPLMEPLSGFAPADKVHFEPIKEASLKHLTFRTVYLLALGSGKRKSEIHAWQNRNIRHQSDWSKVSLYPSPSFLSKNQLAKERPDSVAPGVLTTLAPTLDRSLKSDSSLCPVRALRYYLDRASGRIRRWFLSPLRKVWTKPSHLPLSPLGSSRLWSYVMSSLTRRPTLYIRLKPMMSGPLLLLRSSSRESP